MKPAVSKRKQKAGLLYGLAAGLAFAIFTWGVDAFLLACAHGVFPWVNFVPGLVIGLVSSALVGWLTARVERAWFSLLLWLLQALLFAHLVVWLPIKVAPRIIFIFNPALGDFLQYPFHHELYQNLWISFAVIALVSLIIGLIENILIEQALFSSGTFSLIVPLVVCFLSFSLVGNFSDSILNKRFRESVQQVDEVIDFILAHEGQEVPQETALKMRLFAFDHVKDVVSQKHGLIMSNYDEMLGQVDVLVDFNGQWVKCPVIYNQLVTCSRIFENPAIRLGSTDKHMSTSVNEGPPI